MTKQINNNKKQNKSKMKTTKSIEELIKDNSCPFPIGIIPDKMGINLVSVESISWERQDDGQLVNLTINFIPANETENALSAPDKYPLDVLLQELKFGRPAAAQHLIDKWIEEVKRKNTIPDYQGELIKDWELCMQFDNDEPIIIYTRSVEVIEGLEEVEVELLNYIIRNREGSDVTFISPNDEKQVKFFFREITESGIEKRKLKTINTSRILGNK